MDLIDTIRVIPDHPKPGIQFRDITTLLGDGRALAQAVADLAAPFADAGIAKVAGCEARGFILGAGVALGLGAGFVPLRKKGKLPHKTFSARYALEYGFDELEMHCDACLAGEKVLLIDDLIATGGTAAASIDLLRQSGAQVVGAGFVIALDELGGTARLQVLEVPVHALIRL